MIDRHKLLDTLLDNQSLSDSELILKIEGIISGSKPFDHKASSIYEACNVTDITSPENKGRDFSELGNEFKTISSRVETIERLFTKRELAFLLIENVRKVEHAKEALNSLDQLKKDL